MNSKCLTFERCKYVPEKDTNETLRLTSFLLKRVSGAFKSGFVSSRIILEFEIHIVLYETKDKFNNRDYIGKLATRI